MSPRARWSVLARLALETGDEGAWGRLCDLAREVGVPC